jgi:hypothetical protein
MEEDERDEQLIECSPAAKYESALVEKVVVLSEEEWARKSAGSSSRSKEDRSAQSAEEASEEDEESNHWGGSMRVARPRLLVYKNDDVF